MNNVKMNNKMNRLIVKHNNLCDFSQRISKKNKALKRKKRYWRVKYLQEKKNMQSNRDMLDIIEEIGT